MNKQQAREAFSQELEELRNLATYVTKDQTIKLRFDPKAPTASFNHKENLITLTTNHYPPWVVKNERILKKMLDADVLHESLHHTKTKPLVPYVESWIKHLKLKRRSFPQLASAIVNMIEDKRVNSFGKDRYRFDLGKREELFELVFKDMMEENLGKSLKEKGAKKNKAGLILGAVSDKTLYNVDISPMLALLNDEEKKDVDTCLELVKQAQYQAMRIDVVNTYKKVYEIIAKHVTKKEADQNIAQFCVKAMIGSGSGYKGQTIEGDISDKLKKLLSDIIKAEENAEKKLEEDLKKGEGAGEGTGAEIPPPEPDIAEYEQIVADVKPEIDRLLGKLKRILKPYVRQDIYQKQGRIMSHLVARAYVSSFHRAVQNIYVKNALRYEKEKISLGMIIDYSASVSKSEAQKITTILTEVFGNFVEDYGFAIGVFAENQQRIKSFFEEFQNTRARIPNIGVNSSGTRVHDILEGFLKMFNSIHEERRKVLVIASDFSFFDEAEAEKVIVQYAKSGIEILFMGFGSCDNVKTFASKVKGIKRSQISDIRDLPERFVDVYLDVEK